MERINQAIDVPAIRAILKTARVRARVQTYRNHDDISILPVYKETGFSDDDVAAIAKVLEAQGLADWMNRVEPTNPKPAPSARKRIGFKYIRPV